MRKYWAFFKTSVQNTLTYRGPILVWLIGNLLSLIVLISVWQAVGIKGHIGGYTQNQLITYALFGLFLMWLVNWAPFEWLKDEIANGDIIGGVLLKPLSLYFKVFAQELGWHVISVWVGLFASVLVGFIIRDYLVMPSGPANFLLIAVAIVLAILVNFTASLCLGMTAFWSPRVNQLEAILWAGRTLLGGQGIPISFFPANCRLLIEFLPFRYMFSFPIEIFLGRLSLSEIFTGLAIGSGWCLLLILLYKFMWNRGRQIYTAVGQ